MISVKKFWTCVLIECVLLLSVCIYAESTKVETPWQQPTYKVNSDILNFNYNEMAYPSSSVSIGVKSELEKKNTPPKKRLPAPKSDNDEVDEILNGMLNGVFSVLFVALCPIPVIVLLMIVYLAVEAHGKKKRNKLAKMRLEERVNGISGLKMS